MINVAKHMTHIFSLDYQFQSFKISKHVTITSIGWLQETPIVKTITYCCTSAIMGVIEETRLEFQLWRHR